MTEIEQFINETINKAARRAYRRSSGSIEECDIVGHLWEKVLPLRDHPDRWNKEYLSVVIWKNAFAHHQRKVEPIPLIDESDVTQSEDPPSCYMDLRGMVSEIRKDDTRLATEMYLDGLSLETIAKELNVTKERVNALLGNAKRQLRTSMKKLAKPELDAIRNSR